MKNDGNRGRGVFGHPLLTLLGVISSVLGIVTFFTGNQKFSDFFQQREVAVEPSNPLPEQTPKEDKTAFAPINIDVPENSERQNEPSSREILVDLDPSRTEDIWTTSIYSYAPNGGGPGGGLDDEGLRVGGWGDVYYSLLRFNLDGLPKSVLSAELRLYSLPNQKNDGPCPLFLDLVKESWDWKNNGTGSDRARLWWADRPSTEEINDALPAPEHGGWYSIEITDVYNSWQSGDYPNYGLQLRPSRNDNRGSIFVSSNGQSHLRPRLALKVEATPD